MQKNGFRLLETHGVPAYVCTAIEQHPGVRHGFSTCRGGVSRPPDCVLNLGYMPWDARAHVDENRRRFLESLAIRPEFLVTVAQTHSNDFHIINTPADQWNPSTSGDALITDREQVAVAVKTADCFPILISDPSTGAIAAVHAGWRGVLNGVLSRTLTGMATHLEIRIKDVTAAIGPGIRPCCFEVGPEVASAFQSAFPGIEISKPFAGRAGKFLVDLPRALQNQLAETGVPPANIFDLGLCTCCCTSEFFSHRAQGASAGRLIAVICRNQ